MKDIQVDADGNFRCWSCGGRNFSEKRTRRAKIIGLTAGVATVGVAGAAAPLVAKKRLYCQGCGEYSKMGNAQPYAAPASRVKPAAPVDQSIADRAERLAWQRSQPVRHRPSTEASKMEGKFLEVKKPIRKVQD
ncbi:hypothetical protein [Gordonia sputi]|uniref:Uncharacterized protein n=1 Tax=Gordonia sputi NBRC 100414 TaxID=1089453 RepID=H5U5G0_9ACTN|nr:hypothetical protein [Gordonia sputi]NKY94180.1 hypothetical protein [Gordonia sputi]GAB40968.1 hypothetical protein GOSPT_118_00450 [Gordonia sputi NBRC 100414]